MAVALFRKPKRGRPPKPKRQWKLPKLDLGIKDAFLFGGLGLAGYGVYQIYPPSAYVLVGGCFVALGILIYLGDSNHESS